MMTFSTILTHTLPLGSNYQPLLRKRLCFIHYRLRWYHYLSKDQDQGSRRGKHALVYGIFGGMALCAAYLVEHLHEELGGIEGIERSLSFYSVAIPRYLEYRIMQWSDSNGDKNDEWDELHRRASKQGLDKIMELRGFYIKTGQMAASNIGNAFPKIWQHTLSVLQDKCPHKEFNVVKDIIESEYQKPLSDIFKSIESTPIGAASIGQVHRATLAHTEDPVVVKVMYPEVERVFRGDVRTLKMFCKVAQPVHVPALEQTEKHFMTEFDYRKEAMQQDIIRNNLMKAGLAGDRNDQKFVIPKIYLDYCTKRVMVMEYIEGEKLIDALLKDAQGYATYHGKTVEQLRHEEELLDSQARAKGELRFGPTVDEFNSYIAILDAKRRAHNLVASLYNATVSWWLPGAKTRDIHGKNLLPLNQAQIVDDLNFIHGHQVLIDGVFNGDPHPGNILLVRNKDGNMKLGLIDYGQVMFLSKDDRLLFAALVIALAEDDRQKIVQLMKVAGFKSKNMNEDVIYRYAKVYYDDDNPEITGGDHIQVFVEKLQAIDPIINIPDQFIMIGRTSIMLRGLGHALHQHRSIAKSWKPLAEKVLSQELLHSTMTS